jgi:hypothetical protein
MKRLHRRYNGRQGNHVHIVTPGKIRLKGKVVAVSKHHNLKTVL